MKKWREQRPQSREAVTTDELEATYERLKQATEGNEDLHKDLDRLKSTAESGLRVSWWSRRFMFGFGMGKAIEDWFVAYDKTDPNKPVLDRIPRDETSNVAAKWLWFGFFTSLVAVIFSLTVAGVTAVFLYQQTGVLARQAEIAEQQAQHIQETNYNAQRRQYMQILYDENCEIEIIERVSESPNNDLGAFEKKDVCTPIYNHRIRSEAVMTFLQLDRTSSSQPDLSKALLQNAILRDIDLSSAILIDARLSGAILSGAILSGANLSSTNLIRADLSGANLFSADLSGTDLIWADLSGADLAWADLSGADLSGADLSGASLRGANLSSAILIYIDPSLTQDKLDTACGDDSTRLPQDLTITSCD